MASGRCKVRRLLAALGWFVLVAGVLAGFLGVVGIVIYNASDLLPPEWGQWVMDLISDGLSSLFGERYAAFEPDVFVYDNRLSLDVPRMYYLSIPKIGLYAPVVQVNNSSYVIEGVQVSQSHVPHAFAVGWVSSSAPVGARGNTVFVGHNNIYGEVFKDLWSLQEGDEIAVETAGGIRTYRVWRIAIFTEGDRPISERLNSAQWIRPTNDERLTLVTCYPYYTNTHRLIVVAVPT
jgi:LPXTG-site transpeptidase (sortase) family protein